VIVTDCDLRAEQVSKRYGEATALPAVSLAVGGGAVVLGPPGSGKSVLARLLAGRERPTTGTVTFNGEDLAELLRTRAGRFRFHTAVGYVGPDSAAVFDPRRSLRDGLRLPLRVRYRMSGLVADERIDATLGDLGLTEALADRRPAEVAPAVRQRFALARALVIRPRLLLYDSPPMVCGLPSYGRERGLHLVVFARSLSDVRLARTELDGASRVA
jgi:ABC-type dipeptide/oligopeptide/nickel transport system ATPase subunit